MALNHAHRPQLPSSASPARNLHDGCGSLVRLRCHSDQKLALDAPVPQRPGRDFSTHLDRDQSGHADATPRRTA